MIVEVIPGSPAEDAGFERGEELGRGLRPPSSVHVFRECECQHPVLELDWETVVWNAPPDCPR
jgi:hypothetical protein